MITNVRSSKKRFARRQAGWKVKTKDDDGNKRLGDFDEETEDSS